MAHTWVTGEVITARKLNDLEQTVSGHTTTIEWARQEINSFDANGDGVVDYSTSCLNVAESVVSPIVASESEYPVVADGEKVKISYGKFIKWMSDARTHLKTGLLSVGNNLFTVSLSSVTRASSPLTTDDSTEIATTAYVKSNLRRYSPTDNGVVSNAAYATSAGDASTVSGHTVEVDVPSDAEFTDTTDLSDMDGELDLATQVTGVLGLSHVPQGALERLKIVANQAARYALTTSDVQNGDSVKQLDTGTMYIVVDDTRLDQAAGYVEYTAGSATYATEAGSVSPSAIDTVVTGGSSKLITSGAVANAISAAGGGDMLKADYDPNDDKIIDIANGGTNANTAAQARINLGLDDASLLSLMNPIGTIVHSTTCDTMAKVVAAYGGTAWIQHTGYMLRGAISSVTSGSNVDAWQSSHTYAVGNLVIYNNIIYKCITAHTSGSSFTTAYWSTANDGGADSVTVSSVASHNHTQNQHRHGGATGGTNKMSSYAEAGSTDASRFIGSHGYTAYTTPTNNANGSNYTVNTLPAYKNVYIWERIA